MSWLIPRKFLSLLLALGAMFVLQPIFNFHQETKWVYDLLLTGIFLAAFLVILRPKKGFLIGFVLMVLTLIGIWTDYVIPGLPPLPVAVAFHASAAIFLFFSVIMILKIIYADPNVTADSVYGGFCGYLLIGIAFGHLYCLVEVTNPRSFQVSTELLSHLQNETLLHSLLTYFSFVTLTTVGFGDIIPTHPVTRWLAAVEGILGQFYIAVLMAELIGKRVSQAVAGKDNNPNEKTT